MFGKNPIRKIDMAPEDGKLAVQEVFYTLQGEGPFTGHHAVFIRLAGCHLACTFCDTEFESNINNRLTAQQVVDHANLSLPGGLSVVPIVVITGGEPMRQRLGPLVNLLHAHGYKHVQIETAGNSWEAELEHWLDLDFLTVVCSPKTAHVHKSVQLFCHHWKYVVKHDSVGSDGLPRIPTQANAMLPPWNVNQFKPAWTQTDTVWISPCDDHEIAQTNLNVNTAVRVCLEQGYRLSLQTHKIVDVR